MVVEENSVKELPFSPSKKLFVVKQEVSFQYFDTIFFLADMPCLLVKVSNLLLNIDGL